MEQLSFFPEAGQSKGLPTELLDYRPGLIPPGECARLYHKFATGTPWRQQLMKMYDKQVLAPRLSAWYGEVQDGYLPERISEINAWTPELQMIRKQVQALSGMIFNSVLLNYYRNANDSVAWHSDKGAIQGKTVVASVSLGQVRSFDIRNKWDHNERYSVRLENGSYLLMKAGLQDDWEHRIAKSTKPMQGRINLTFRAIGEAYGHR